MAKRLRTFRVSYKDSFGATKTTFQKHFTKEDVRANFELGNITGVYRIPSKMYNEAIERIYKEATTIEIS